MQHHFAETAISSTPGTVEPTLERYLGPTTRKRKMPKEDMAYATGALSGRHPAASTNTTMFDHNSHGEPQKGR